MAQHTYDDEAPFFEVFVYLDENYNDVAAFGVELEKIKLTYPNVDLRLSEYPIIKAIFGGFLTYEQTKNIMFYFYGNYQEGIGTTCVDGWGSNYEVDPRMFDIQEIYYKEEHQDIFE